MDEIKKGFVEARDILDNFISDGSNFKLIGRAGDIMVESLKAGGKIISCGNGGSMCDAMHFAEELTGRYRDNRSALAAIAISDPSYLTCAGNDYGFDQIFSRFIEGVGTSGDNLLAITTSGNSENVIKAAAKAKEIGMSVIGLTGKNGGGLSALCDVEIRAPYSKYADRAQEIHVKIIHSLILYIEKNL